MKKKICVLGSYVTDLTSWAPHLPVEGETVKGSMFKMGPGGKGSNQAVAVKRSGGDVRLITKLGSDVFGQEAKRFYEAEGLLSEGILFSATTQTGTALIMVDEKSKNSILVVPGACGEISYAELDSLSGLIIGSDILLTQLEINLDATYHAIRMAKEAGVQVIMNTAPVQPIDPDVLKLIDIVTPNEVEAAMITGLDQVSDLESCRRAADIFFSRGVQKVVITLGHRGVYGHDGHEDRLIPCVKVDAVDTTGAGDAFNGGFVTALADSKSFFDAIEFGNFTAAIAVTRLGTAPAMPMRSEIEAFMEERRQLAH